MSKTVDFSDDEKSLAQCLKERYGIEVRTLKRLSGLTDVTYKVNDDYVLKIYIMPQTADPIRITAEIRVVTFLLDKGFPVAEVIKTLNGEEYTCAELMMAMPGDEVKKRSRPILLQKFLHGDLWFDTNLTNTAIGKVAGQFLGRLDNAFQDFQVDVSDETGTDLLRIIRVRKDIDVRIMIKLVEDDPKKFRLIERVIQLFNEKVLPHVNELPQQQIHGDAHWRNMMVNDERNEIVGLVDLTDSKFTCRIYELGIALATLFKTKSFEFIESILLGYMSQVQLTELENSALLPCILCRTSLIALGIIHIEKTGRNVEDYVESIGGDVWGTIEMLLYDYDNSNRFRAMLNC